MLQLKHSLRFSSLCYPFLPVVRQHLRRSCLANSRNLQSHSIAVHRHRFIVGHRTIRHLPTVTASFSTITNPFYNTNGSYDTMEASADNTGTGTANSAPPPPEEATSLPPPVQTVTEGSCHMCFAAHEETAVFYNPVQVQNRDLSVLMIALYTERRRASEQARLDKKAANRKIRQQENNQQQQNEGNTDSTSTTSNDNTGVNNSSSSSSNAIDDANNHTHATCKIGLHILDALAASGLRSMRYWKECPNIDHITINDLDPAATHRALANLQSNALSDAYIPSPSHYLAAAEPTPASSSIRPHGIRIVTGDATHLMYNSRIKPRQKQYNSKIDMAMESQQQQQQQVGSHLFYQENQWDVIDLDPYGSAVPFLDSAVQAIAHGGMLNVTCTDMAALGGSHPETCFGRYGSMPISRAGYLQELAVRILLYTLATTAARYGRTIKPILSVGMDFYIRVFVEVYDDKAGVNNVSTQVGNVYQSTQCPSFHVVPSGQLGGKKGNVYQPSRLVAGTCIETGSALKIAGPLWMGPMHDRSVLAVALDQLELPLSAVSSYPYLKSIATRDRLRGMLTSCYEELSDAPLFYRLPDLSKCLHLSTPPIAEFKSALLNAGYQVSGYHKDPQAIKTTAPTTVVWDILRAWAKKRPPIKPTEPDSVAAKILQMEPTLVVDFSTPKRSNDADAREISETKISRFPMNPQPNWGPKPKATGIKRKVEDDTNATDEQHLKKPLK